MKNAYRKEIFRTLWKEKKRLAALMVISALGVTMLCGIRSACTDLNVSADRFFDEQNLHDISVVSTLGLTDEDVEALAALEGVSGAEGCYSETVTVEAGETSGSATVHTFTADGIDVPLVKEGRLPEDADEIAVTAAYLTDSGKKIGDTLKITEKTDDSTESDTNGSEAADSDAEDSGATDSDAEDSGATDSDSADDDLDSLDDLEETDSPDFAGDTFTIVGVIVDVTSVLNPDGTTSFRSTGGDDYICVVTPEAVSSDIYTSVNITVEGAAALSTFSDEYQVKVQAVMDRIEEILQDSRETARYESVTGEAQDKLDEAKQKADDAFADAESELSDARQELDDGWQEYNDGLKELSDSEQEAKEQFADARQQIADGKQQSADGKKQLDDAQSQLDAAKAELAAKEQELADGEAQLIAGEQQLAEGKQALTEKQTETETQLAAAKQTLEEQKETAAAMQASLGTQEEALKAGFGEAFPENEWNALKQAAQAAYLEVLEQNSAAGAGSSQAAELPADAVSEQTAALAAAFGPAWSEDYAALAIGIGEADASAAFLESSLAALEQQSAQAEAGFAAAWEEINTNEQTLAASRQELESGKEQLAAGKKQLEENQQLIDEKYAALADGEAQLASSEEELNQKEEEAYQKIADGKQELEDGKQELDDGEAEYADGLAEYQEQKEDAEEKIADAQQTIDEIDACTWYIRDRSGMDGWSDIKSDADCIRSIGTIFPVMFLLVAVLISLTTITRMVEEDRVQIGTYQALGFEPRRIQRRYIILAGVSSILGGLLGNFCGFVIVPEIIFVIFHTMYLIPVYLIVYEAFWGVGGILLFLAAIVLATVVTCHSEVRQTPAVLMRPKSPKTGTRILLERISFLWKRLSFLNKVAARNLFRYKKRLFMTVFGIAGCTALLICGFSIKDTVADLCPKQYENIIRYDALAATAGGDDNDSMLAYLDDHDSEVESYLNLYVSSVSVTGTSGETLSPQIYVVPDGTDLGPYFHLISDDDGADIAVTGEGVYITENIGMILGDGTGSSISVQDLSLNKADCEVLGVCEYYLGNCVFMTKSYYEQKFGTYEPNAALINLKDGTDSGIFCDALSGQDCVMSVTATQKLIDEFSGAFVLMNLVVYVVIVLAAALAFVVLFTLSLTNISERERELATIKVLGFYNPEVHRYVNKETLLLTGIGILAGLPLGVIFSELLGMALTMPAIVYASSIHRISFGIAAVMVFIFAFLVQIITNRSLDNINPANALKSIE